MLNFRNTNWLFIILLALVIAVDIKHDVPFFIYPVIMIAYSLVVFYGCYFVDSNFFLPVICSANTKEKVIAISFDDGPAENFTPEALAILNEHNVKAAFFCIGKNIPGNELLFKRIHEEGHLIGNHSYSHHFWFDLFSSGNMLADLQLMSKKMQEVIGAVPRLFRPPYGVTNPNLAKAIIRGNYTPVGWSVRSLDTVKTDQDKLLKTMEHAVKPGAVFLFHDTSKTTVAILPGFLTWVKENGYEIVRLDKMLNLKAYA